MLRSPDDKSELPYRPTIVRRGLILVLIPLLLGSTILLALDYLWFASNSLILRDQRRNEVSFAIYEAFTAVTSYGYSVINSCFPVPVADVAYPEKVQMEAFRRSHYTYAIADNKLAILDKRIAADPVDFKEELVQKEELAAILGEAQDLAASISQAKLTSNVGRLAVYSKLMRRALLLTDKMISSQNQTRVESTNLRRQQFLLEANIQALLFVALGGGIVISAFLFFDFGRSFITRVKLLARRAADIYSLKADEKLVRGDDELAYLDSILQDAAAQLSRARQEQQMIVQMVAHDMRSPIMAAQVSVTTVERFFVSALPEAAARWCAEINLACNHVLNFVNQLLTLEALDAGTITLSPEDFLLSELVQDCIAALATEASGNAVNVQNNCAKVMVTADRSRVSQVLQIYLTNAIASAPPGSTVRVGSRSQKDFEVLVVADDFPAPAKMQRKRIFDRFSQIRADGREGPGDLGLFICKMLTECQGGKVGVESVAGGGREFWFSLPRDAVSRPQLASKGGIGSHLPEQDGDRPGLSPYIKRSLLGKILLLVAIPIVVQGACLIYIEQQFLKSQQIAAKVQRQAEILSTVNELMLRGYRAKSHSVFWAVFGDDKYKTLAEEDAVALRHLTSILSKEAELAHADAEPWREASEFASVLVGEVEKSLGVVHTGDINSVLNHITDKIDAGFALHERLDRLAVGELNTLSDLSIENERLRQNVQGVILLAALINVCISVLQYLTFRHDISRRVTTLMENARRLPRRDALHAKMPGTDEIAVLDSLIHSAAEELAASDHQRKDVMHLISRNISEPLHMMARTLGLLDGQAAQSLPLDSKGRQNIAAAKRNIDRVRLLADDLFCSDQSESIREQLDKSVYPVSEIIEEAIVSVASLAQAKQIKIETLQRQRPGVPLTVFADRGRLVQVLVNLLSNAIKFSPENTTISIECAAADEALKIMVRDQGPGMDAETRSKVFDKFYSARAQGQKSFGLGLAICKSIVEAHDGKVAVDSRPGQGSLFTVEIPGATG